MRQLSTELLWKYGAASLIASFQSQQKKSIWELSTLIDQKRICSKRFRVNSVDSSLGSCPILYPNPIKYFALKLLLQKCIVLIIPFVAWKPS